MKYSLISFWHLFDYENNFITKDILKHHTYIDFKNSEKLKDIDLLIVGSFGNEENYNLIKALKCKKILIITEPLFNFGHTIYARKLLDENEFYLISGSAINDETLNCFKFPLYLFPFYLNYHIDKIFINTNKFVITTNIDEKKFCCLVNRHDNYNTRTPIYNIVKNIGYIHCPSKLFNNCNVEELNKLGKYEYKKIFENVSNVEYFKSFLFNICPENAFFSNNIPSGYITEKLLNCCLGGAIPIYFGWFDDIDGKIFNKNRILFCNPNDNTSLENLNLKINELMSDKVKLSEFYRQNVFMDTAFETCLSLEKKLKMKLNTINQKYNFMTFASSGFEQGSLKRIKNQVIQFNLFNELYIYDNTDLINDDDFWNQNSNFILNNSRGYGYWIWKSYLILKTLKKLNDGDILIYTDSGCEWNIHGKKRLMEYIEILNSNDKDILGFQLDVQLEKMWTKMDLIEYMKAYEYSESRQLVGGINFFKKTDKTILFVEEWYNTCCNYHLIDDSPSTLPNDQIFKEHRHDQSVFSLLCKKYDVNILDDETWYGPNWLENKNHYIDKPILAMRNNTNVSRVDLS